MTINSQLRSIQQRQQFLQLSIRHTISQISPLQRIYRGKRTEQKLCQEIPTQTLSLVQLLFKQLLSNRKFQNYQMKVKMRRRQNKQLKRKRTLARRLSAYLKQLE
ncbi:hypothetical protein FGO68_gene529 [Halteria grandinella]|uniref:Uncharacterized protein n=1 Tax=Halteria grandinella TaxID=5974 RepID=A0A8J8NA95_HALGN|nr:hypothetical protein FGO68_gene529 [Halteria grandinella]